MKNISFKKTILAGVGIAVITTAIYQVPDRAGEEKVEPRSTPMDRADTPVAIEEIKQTEFETTTDDSIAYVEAKKIQLLTFPQARKAQNTFPIKRLESPRLVFSEPEIFESKAPEVIERKISSLEAKEEWNISLAYGAKYLSITQKVGTIDADLGIVYPSNVQLMSEFIHNDWSAWFQFDSYEFSYETNTSKDKERMSSVEFGSSYKWLMGALGVEQNPLFNMTDQIVGLARQSTTYVAIGAKKDIELTTQKPSSLNLKAWFSYPIATMSSNADVELSNVSGMGVRGQVEFNRQIMKGPDYSLHATWSTNVGYQKIEQDLKWGNLDEKVKTTIIGASSTIGLELKF